MTPVVPVTFSSIKLTTWAEIGNLVIVIVVLWLGIGAHLLEVREGRIEDATKDGSNLSYAAEQSIDGMISGIDQMLLSIRAAYAGDREHFNIDKWVTDTKSLRTDFEFSMIDRNGMLQANQHNAIDAPIDLSFRPYFLVQKNNPLTDELFLSEPLMLRTTGKWSVVFSRKFTAIDGSFDGTVVLSLDPAWLTRLYDTLEIGHGTLMVTGIDGIVRARASGSGTGIGQNIGLPAQRLVKGALAVDHGTSRSISPLDGIDRFVSFRRLPDYPLVVSVGLNAAEVFAPYYHECVICLIVGTGLTILILIIAARLHGQSERLRQSRQVLSDAVENISQGLMMIDKNGNILLLNKRAFELLGLPPEFRARTPSFGELLRWQIDTAEFGPETAMEKRILARDEPSRFDFRNSHYERTRPDGRELEVRTQVLASGGAMRTFTDVTERRRTERQLAQSQKMEAIGNLTGGIAHDFNNGLGIVIGNLDLLDRLVKSNLPAAELCAEARDGALRCADLIRRLLAFARQQPLRPRQTDVNALIDNFTTLIRRTLGERITMTLCPDDALWPVLADPGQLEAALVNLAANARDAMPRGGRLDIVTRRVHVDAGSADAPPDLKAGDYGLIEISDTGTGIPPEIIGRIFEPFFTTKELGHGTGLGLSMTFGFARQSGGSLTVVSEPGLGTTFRLYLPRDDAGVASMVTMDERAVVGGDEKVLVVEDNAPLRLATERQLIELGYQVRGTDNATAALNILAGEDQIDLLFTDIVMPGTMDGLDLAVEAARRRPGLKVLLMSGFPELRGADGRLAGCPFLLLTKPFRRDGLAWTLREVLDRHDQQKPPAAECLAAGVHYGAPRDDAAS